MVKTLAWPRPFTFIEQLQHLLEVIEKELDVMNSLSLDVKLGSHVGSLVYVAGTTLIEHVSVARIEHNSAVVALTGLSVSM